MSSISVCSIKINILVSGLGKADQRPHSGGKGPPTWDRLHKYEVPGLLFGGVSRDRGYRYLTY